MPCSTAMQKKRSRSERRRTGRGDYRRIRGRTENRAKKGGKEQRDVRKVDEAESRDRSKLGEEKELKQKEEE